MKLYKKNLIILLYLTNKYINIIIYYSSNYYIKSKI
jgi:hypothetical protein